MLHTLNRLLVMLILLISTALYADDCGCKKDFLPIKVGNVYVTRGGNEVRIYAVDGDGPNQVHGAACINGWQSQTWKLNGCYYASCTLHVLDIVGLRK